MNIKVQVVGDLQCNCYLVEKNGDALLIDPGDELPKILKLIQDKNVLGILLTHHHFDHVGCVDYLVEKYHYPVYDASNLKEGIHYIGNFSFEVIYTFGHTMDSITYYFKDDQVMFTGDFLFYDSIGRCDFPESNVKEMGISIEKIKKYNDNIVVYPGHGMKTSLGREKKYNFYFRNLGDNNGSIK